MRIAEEVLVWGAAVLIIIGLLVGVDSLSRSLFACGAAFALVGGSMGLTVYRNRPFYIFLSWVNIASGIVLVMEVTWLFLIR